MLLPLVLDERRHVIIVLFLVAVTIAELRLLCAEIVIVLKVEVTWGPAEEEEPVL